MNRTDRAAGGSAMLTRLGLLSVLAVVASVSSIGCSEDAETGAGSYAVSGPPSLTVVSKSVAPRAKPGGTLAVSITVKNTGSTTWRTGSVTLAYVGDAGVTNATLAL